MYIGDKIKSLRKAHHLTLTRLSTLSGVQLATLSRIEHKKMIGTVESHMKIAKALNIDVTELYKDVGQKNLTADMTTADKDHAVTRHKKSSFEILTQNALQKKMIPILIHIEPGGKTNKGNHARGSEKFIYVLAGAIEAVVGVSAHTLAKRHSMYFDGSIPHYLKNNGKIKAQVLSITTPVAL